MEKRPLRDVIPPGEKATKRPARTAAPRRSDERDQEPPHEPPVPRPGGGGGRWRLWAIAVIAVAVLGVAFSFLFSGTKLTVVPQQRDVRIDVTLEAFRDPGPGELGYETMQIERTLSTELAATGEEEVETRARGTIVVFNDHSAESQRLVRDTRFESPDGLIYRIQEPIVVPGQQTVDDEVVPGSIEVEVVADKPGEEYNIGLTDFTIPGFAGSARFETFFARSKTPMSGGFAGVRRTVPDGQREEALEALRSDLANQLVAAAASQKPDGFVLYGDLTFFTFNEPEEQNVGDDTLRLSLSGVLQGVLLDESALAAFIAAETIAGYEGEPIRLADPAALSITVPDRETARPWEEPSVTFTVTGSPKLVWQFDADQLARDLAGKSKDALSTVLSGYPAIEEAEAIVRPFWRGTFPDEPEDIRVTVKLDAGE